MRSNKVIIALGLAVLFASGAIAIRCSPDAAAQEGKENKIKALLKQRHAVLETIVATTTAAHQTGSAPFVRVVEAKRTARNAELDLCDTDKERVVVLEKMLQEAKEFEKVFERGNKAGQVTEIAFLKVTADRLEVEIALERAKAK